MNESPSKSQLLIYQNEDGRIRLDVRFEGETVWLTQPMIADLFETTIPNVSMHLRNIFEEGELTPEATVKNFLTVRQEGHYATTGESNSTAALGMREMQARAFSARASQYLLLKAPRGER